MNIYRNPGLIPAGAAGLRALVRRPLVDTPLGLRPKAKKEDREPKPEPHPVVESVTVGSWVLSEDKDGNLIATSRKGAVHVVAAKDTPDDNEPMDPVPPVEPPKGEEPVKGDK